MRFYESGPEGKPVILLVPGTCCPWQMFSEVTPLLEQNFHVVAASFDGFDETEPGKIYPGMVAETEAIETFAAERFGGRIACVYGSSLGGSFVSFLVQRGHIHIDHAIIGSSDMDEAGPFVAGLQGRLIATLLGGAVRTGKLPAWMRKRLESKDPETATYMRLLLSAMGFSTPRSFVTNKSIRRQFADDLVVRIDDGIDVPGTTIHVFYATKMGEQYRERYLRHFARPDIREHALQHEELLVCQPEAWAAEVRACVMG